MSKPNSEERHTAGPWVENDAMPVDRTEDHSTDWEVLIHAGNPNKARIEGLAVGHMPESEGGGYWMPVKKARRIVAAVNATQGITTASLESGVLGELVEALEPLAFFSGDVVDDMPRLTAMFKKARAVLNKLKATT